MSKVLREQFKKAKVVSDELEDEYDSSRVRIMNTLDEFYEDIGEVNLNNGKKIMTQSELKDFKRTIKYYMTDNISDEWYRELERYLDRVRVQKMELVIITITHEFNRLSKMEEDYNNELLEEVMEDSYYKTLYYTTMEMGVSKKFNKFDLELATALHNKPWADDKKIRYDRIWDRNTVTVSYLSKRFLQTLKAGVGKSTIQNEVDKNINRNKYRANLLVTQETAYYTSHGKKEGYIEIGSDKYRLVAVLDDRTSEICQEMDGQVFNMSEYEVGVTAPPFHIWCRTETITEYDDNFIERFARDGESVYSVDGDMTYEEWFETFIK